jgi:hypothetical protein
MKISVSILGKKIESMIPNKKDGIVTSLEWMCMCGKKMRVSLYKQRDKVVEFKKQEGEK